MKMKKNLLLLAVCLMTGVSGAGYYMTIDGVQPAATVEVQVGSTATIVSKE